MSLRSSADVPLLYSLIYKLTVIFVHTTLKLLRTEKDKTKCLRWHTVSILFFHSFHIQLWAHLYTSTAANDREKIVNKRDVVSTLIDFIPNKEASQYTSNCTSKSVISNSMKQTNSAGTHNERGVCISWDI